MLFKFFRGPFCKTTMHGHRTACTAVIYSQQNIFVSKQYQMLMFISPCKTIDQETMGTQVHLCALKYSTGARGTDAESHMCVCAFVCVCVCVCVCAHWISCRRSCVWGMCVRVCATVAYIWN